MPGSVIWQVDREAALLLGAGRALLLQIAHPLVAAGVVAHSRFARDPWGRLRRTLETTYAIVFGDRRAVTAALTRFEAVHRRVRGTTTEDAAGAGTGTPYDASDPALRLWVHATLVDTSLVVYERFVAPLSPAAAAAYYEDSRALGRLVGVPEALLPRTLDGLRAYLATMLATEIAVGATARALARQIFRPPGHVTVALVSPLVRMVTIGLLPAALRAQYGFRLTSTRERLLDAFARAVRTTLPILPSVLRVVPQARAAERRLRLERR